MLGGGGGGGGKGEGLYGRNLMVGGTSKLIISIKLQC